MEPPKNAQPLPHDADAPLAMHCWLQGGIVCSDGTHVPFRAIIGSWVRFDSDGVGALCTVGGDDEYVGEWVPRSRHLDGPLATDQPCVLTRGSSGRQYCKFRWLAYGNCPRGQSGQIDYHRQLAQDLLVAHLPYDRVVHHKGWDNKDNRVSNLEVVDKRWHDFIGNQRRGERGARRGEKRDWAASRR